MTVAQREKQDLQFLVRFLIPKEVTPQKLFELYRKIMRERFFIQTNLHTLKVILEQRDRLVTTMAKENLNLKSQAQDAMMEKENVLAQVKILLELVKDLRETAQSESFKVDKLTRQLEKIKEVTQDEKQGKFRRLWNKISKKKQMSRKQI